MPTVSVVLLSYQQARFLPESLGSIAAQTFRDFEVIAVDDGSTDGSPGLIRQWLAEHPGVPAQLVVHQQNQGVCRSLNDAYAGATGRYLTGLAADDLWLPGKLAEQVAAFDRLPERVAVLYGDAHRIDEHGAGLPGDFLAEHGITGPPPQGDVFARLLEGNFVPATTAMLRRSAVEQVGAFDESLRYEDWDYLLRLARDHEFAYFDYIGTKYRVVNASLTRHVRTDLASHARIMRKCLGARPECDGLVLDRLEWLGGELARERHPEAARALGAVLRHRRRPRLALRWAAAALRRYPRPR